MPDKLLQQNREEICKKKSAKHLVLVAGGTGGHVFPALVIAQELLQQNKPFSLITDRRGIRYIPKNRPYVVKVMPLDKKGKGLVGSLKYAFQLLVSFLYVFPYIWRNASLVLGFSGFPTFPALLAASILRIDIRIQEQNAVLGRINRLFFTKAKKVYWSLFGNISDFKRYQKRNKRGLFKIGLPIRDGFLKVPLYKAPGSLSPSHSLSPQSKSGSKESFHLLVTGGSQGAQSFSRVIPQSIARLPQEFLQNLVITHQVRPEDQGHVEAIYAGLPLKGYTVIPFIEDMAAALSRAHLVIARSGAGTCAELIATGRPSILVPYPFATDNHQLENAKGLAKAGGCFLIEHQKFKVLYLQKMLFDLMTNSKKLLFCSRQLKGLKAKKIQKALVSDLGCV